MRVHTCSEIRNAERASFQRGVTTSIDLMEIVIKRLWNALKTEPLLAGRTIGKVSLYTGKGNNAGDALGLAALIQAPITMQSVCYPSEFSRETKIQFDKLAHRLEDKSAANSKGRHKPADLFDRIAERLFMEEAPAVTGANGQVTLIIDGILGSGVNKPLSPEYEELVIALNKERQQNPDSIVLSIDIPTGLHADTGELMGKAVRADITAAIGCVKPGMLVDGAEDYVGRLLCIPLPHVKLPECTEAYVADDALLRYLPRRDFSCYKNKAGRVNIIAGSCGFVGAAQMCAEAALAAGAGLVALYCPKDVYPILAARTAPEIMVHPVESFRDIPVSEAQAWVIGPGMGRPTGAEVGALRCLIERVNVPVVLDADALNLAAALGWPIPRHCILTPHPGEMRRLFPAFGSLSRVEAVQAFLAMHPCTLLLKGARSLIANPLTTYYNSSGGPFMANGGQGDVLAGVIGALAAQGVPSLQAASLGAYACGLAAELALYRSAYPRSVSASQVIAALSAVLAR